MKKNYIKPALKPYGMGPVNIMEGSPANVSRVKKVNTSSFFDESEPQSSGFWN